MEKDNYKTKVVFRKYKIGGDILAIFPENEHNGYLCECYERIGQHGGADYNHCIRITNPAKPDEYQSLKKELENLGYDLDVKQKHIRSKT